MHKISGVEFVAALTIGVGIACTATAFSWIDSVLLHPFPGTSRSDQLAVLEMISPDAPNGGTSISWLDYRDYRDQLKSLSGLAVRRQSAFSLGDGQPAKLIWGELVSGNYFDVMGVKPQLGRGFSREEAGDARGAYPVVVISDRLWRDYFEADPQIAGKTVRINRNVLTVIGVAPPEFRGSSPIIPYDVWVPFTMGVTLGLVPESTFLERGERGRMDAIGRLADGVSMEQARAEAAAFASNLTSAFPQSNRRIGATVLSTWDAHNGVNDYLKGPLSLLLAVAFVVLLIVCANVANLLLAKSIGRQREFGIRFALGASRFRVASQVLKETLVLAMAGTGIGLLMLLWSHGALLAMTPSIGYPIQVPLELNVRIIGFTALCCLLAALAAGASPAFYVFHSNLNDVLKEGGRSETVGMTSRRTRNLLVIGEIALATVALASAGLFIQSFRNLSAVNRGFRAESVLMGRFFIETAGYSTDQILQFSLRLKERMLATPGVVEVSYTDFVPLSSPAGPYNQIQVEGYTAATGEPMSVNRAIVGPGYFATVEIPIVEGRDFNALDERNGAPVIIVNQAFAKRYFGGGNPIGRKVRAARKWCTVVGLARDSKYFSPAESPAPHFYLPFSQFYNASPEMYFLIRTTGPPAMTIPALRASVNEIDSSAGAFHAVPLSEYTELATFGQKVAARLTGGLGLLCLFLAALGLYSLMAYSVSQRMPEIGMRIVMGASPASVVGMVVKEGMAITVAGFVVGTAAAIAAGQIVKSMLFQADSWGLTTIVPAGVFLAGVAFLATLLPALRASRTDPMSALRR